MEKHSSGGLPGGRGQQTHGGGAETCFRRAAYALSEIQLVGLGGGRKGTVDGEGALHIPSQTKKGKREGERYIPQMLDTDVESGQTKKKSKIRATNKG